MFANIIKGFESFIDANYKVYYDYYYFSIYIIINISRNIWGIID